MYTGKLNMSTEKDDLGPEIVVEVSRKDIGLEGYLVIDNTAFGRGKGGIRMHEQVTRSEVEELARSMSLKNALAELPFGGAKAGIVYNDANSTNKKQLFQAFIEEIKYYMPEKYVGAPDIRTGEEEMGWLIDITGDRSTTTGKPVDRGGLENKSSSTGCGVAFATEAAAPHAGIDLKGAKVAIDGYGTVGSWSAHFLHGYGVKVVATSGRHGAIYDPEGLNLDELDRLREKGVPITEHQNSKHITLDEMLHLDVDILITASVSDIIHKDNYQGIHAKLIVEGSNLPMDHSIEEKLHEKGILVVPDIVANSGGVIASCVEYETINATETQMRNLIQDKISTMTDHVLQQAHNRNEYPRATALELATERLKNASN